MKNEKILICGSIGYGGINELKDFIKFLRSENLNIIDYISEEDMDYTHIKDFRDKQSLSEKIINHDLQYIDDADIIVILTNKPSFGTAMEQMYAFNKKKKIILYSEDPVPT
ncbi:MAG: hypothetical protein GF311_12200, partial [Candidatus Lokiarchaeota archaeon]|nr:hypothetical protein [Candidatus Lokiarchaeota archaeon]